MKKQLLVSVLLFMQTLLTSTAHAQTSPTKQWDVRFGGSSGDALTSLQQTTDGGYILGGVSQSGISGDKTQASQGSGDYWVVKISSSGAKEWDARFGGSGNDDLISLQQTSDGGYILGGVSQSGISGDKTQASQGSDDYWVVKINSSGAKEWDVRFGGSGDDYLRSLQQTTDGGYILGGHSFSGISGDKTQASQGGTDYWVVKINSNGVKQWDARFGGSSNDFLGSLQQTTDGGYILGGSSASGTSGDKTQASQGSDDYWVVKINSSGAKEWDVRFGGSGDDYLRSLQQTTDGGYIFGGRSFSGISGDKTQASQGSDDYWVVKINSIGVKEWDAGFGGSSSERLTSLQQTTDGGYILGGYSASDISGDKTQASQGFFDYWVLKINSSGLKQWDASFGGSLFDYLNSLQQTTDGGYILGGYSDSGISGDKTQASQGSDDYWVVKIGFPVWTGTTSTAWDEPTNWSTGVLPTATDSVIIPDVSSASNNFPALNTNTTIKSLTILPNAKLTVNSNQSLTLTHHIVNEDSLILKESGTVEVGGTFNNSGKIVLEGTGSTPSSLEVSGTFTNSGNIAIGYLQGFNIIQGKLTAAGAFTNTLTGVVNIWGSLETNAALTNEGTIDIEATGGLTQGIASTLSNTGTMTCNIEVAQYAGGSFASPMNNYSVNAIPELSPSGTNGAQIIPVQSPSSFRCNADSVAANSPYGNILELREDASLLDNCGQSLWHVKASGSFENARGYVFTQVPTFGSRAELTYTGTVNNGAVSYSGLGRQNIPDIDQWDGLATSTSGWHLVSNPYPGPITLSAATLTAMGFDAQIHFIGNGNFISVNPLATTTIAKGQAFQIRKTSVGGSASFALDNNNRTVNLLALPQYRQQQPQQQYVNITLANAQYENTAMVYFEEEATSAFDSKYDANRLFGAKHVPLIYTTEANGERLSYNALPLLEVGNTQTVPVGVYDGATAGEFTLSFDGITTLNATVMLEDLKLNTLQQVTEGSTYNFTTQAGDSRDRFLLHFEANLATGIINMTDQGVRLFPNPTTGETNLILTENHGFSKATVTDVSGRTVQTYELNKTNTKETLNTASLNNGIYFIQLTGSNSNQTLKLIKQ